MGYGVCAIRLDLGKEARVRTTQFFNIPGSLSRNEVVKSIFLFLFSFNSFSLKVTSVNWLLTNRTYHHGEVDLKVFPPWYSCLLMFHFFLQSKSSNNLPFRTPLLGLLLRGYLIDGKPKQDKLLVARLQREQKIPLPLIAMGTVLVKLSDLCRVDFFLTHPFQIGHSLQEYASGYKVENHFSVTNLASQCVFRLTFAFLSCLMTWKVIALSWEL